MIRIVTLPGWMYITNQHICFYASLPGKKVNSTANQNIYQPVWMNNRKARTKQVI